MRIELRAEEWMKTAVMIAILSAMAFAQDPAAVESIQAACGPPSVNFSVNTDTPQRPNAQPVPGKGMVFVVEDLGQCIDCEGTRSPFSFTNVQSAITKVGVDGAWVGANKGNSYLSFAVTPGEHHLCINWQSRISERSRAFAFANFTAEAGKTYYFRERVFPGRDDYSFDLDKVNSDEGKYLVASSPYSVSKTKK